MRIGRWALTVLVTANTVVWAQQEAVPSLPYHQAPDKDGVYFVGPEVSQPALTHATPAKYTDEMSRNKNGGMSIWSVTVRADGTTADAHLVQPLGTSFDAAAIEAIKQASFEPGKLNGKPVAVRVGVAVPFQYGKYPSTPVIGVFERDLDPNNQSQHFSNASPIVIHTASWSLSTNAIHAKYQGVSLVSVMVGEDGLPGEPRVVQAVGMGLDEKAIEVVTRFRFRPAMKDGRPVAARTNVEVKFLIY